MSQGHWEISRILINAFPPSSVFKNYYQANPREVSLLRGLTVPSDLVNDEGISSENGSGEIEKEKKMPKTLIVRHELCEMHRSCPSFERGGPEPPPENSKRLEVIYNSDTGVLSWDEFSALEWENNPPKAMLADISRVHDFNYLKRLEKLCSSIPDIPTAICHLDGDTAVSRKSYDAALRAAGSVCLAIDRVCGPDRKNRNAFCAVRPPGHHAGPRGLVTTCNDKEGSNGFCLLNNVAIGASYARHMYRGLNGVSKVAIVDFDVHHGNGTEAIVRSLIPTEIVSEFSTPMCTGTLRQTEGRPWLSEDDADNCFYLSVHGYGKKDPIQGPNGWFYPGSGATSADLNAFLSSSCGHGENFSDLDKSIGAPSAMSAEITKGCEKSEKSSGKKSLILNMGYRQTNPDEGRLKWREVYRNMIFPSLIEFNPDLILVSAGFDAHYKELINFDYISLVEEDFEWVTTQLVQIANRCCDGKLVSVLEGGYAIQGGPISAFGKSVACHVRALQDGEISRQKWNHEISRREQELEVSAANLRKQKRIEIQIEKRKEREAFGNKREISANTDGLESKRKDEIPLRESSRKRPRTNYLELAEKLGYKIAPALDKEQTKQ
eukprot:CAMPEP_0171459748 /NCGR_PEP_ID=MMETSP0945-20130129/4901_1 /TAXON_ID=109269 /ORGANISM="Vaucheria litorea, Strain CCMP2940" /LENGTH=606 /DNA_ID=CAMNT_0011985815 /DNA_START=371 /DNA_END=2191 /DNA_ORIENTATION=+